MGRRLFGRLERSCGRLGPGRPAGRQHWAMVRVLCGMTGYPLVSEQICAVPFRTCMFGIGYQKFPRLGQLVCMPAGIKGSLS
jgi:hypothetical protein